MSEPNDHENGERRQLFHKKSGGIDLSRLFEQLLPTLIVGAFVVYANYRVMEGQVADIRMRVDKTEEKVSGQNEKLIALNAQIAAYLGQQTQLNAAMDARMTYLERSGGATFRR